MPTHLPNINQPNNLHFKGGPMIKICRISLKNEIMFRDSVSLFTNKVKEDGDYDEVGYFFAKVSKRL